MAGPAAVLFSRSLRISNRRFREATGWAPEVRNAVEGMARASTDNSPALSPGVPATVRIGLWAMALFSLLAGIQQQFVPRSFYDDFPGFGMRWVAVDGPYNEHLLRDLGGANLALGLVILFAISRPTAALVRAVAAAMLVAQVPHFIYHAAHLSVLPTTLDRAMQTAALSLTLAIPLLVLLRAGGIHEDRKSAAIQPTGVEARNATQHGSGLVSSTR